jgi:hypothetical protein
MRLALACLLPGLAGAPALAQDSGPVAAPEAGASATVEQPVAIRPVWVAALSAGATRPDGGDAGDFESISLTRHAGRAYVRAGVSRYRGTVRQIDTATPSHYLLANLGLGGNFGGWLVDVYGSYGRQVYGPIAQNGALRTSTGARSSAYAAGGISLGRSITLAENWYLTPSASGGFARGRLLRPAPLGRGTDFETREPTWSGAGTARVDHRLGTRRVTYLGGYLTAHYSSNAVSQVAAPAAGGGPGAPGTAVQTAAIADASHRSDVWVEAGLTGMTALSDRLWVDWFVSRTARQVTGDTVTAGAGLRLRL